MKIALKVGDKVRVLAGKFTGKEDVVSFIDKKNGRVRLETLKKQKVKTKKGTKDLHGTFHLTSLKSLKAATETVAAATEQPAS